MDKRKARTFDPDPAPDADRARGKEDPGAVENLGEGSIQVKRRDTEKDTIHMYVLPRCFFAMKMLVSNQGKNLGNRGLAADGTGTGKSTCQSVIWLL